MLRGSPSAKALDGAYMPPPGDDPHLLRRDLEGKDAAGTVLDRMESGDEFEDAFGEPDGLDDFTLDLDEKKPEAGRVRSSPPPTLKGGVLSVPAYIIGPNVREVWWISCLKQRRCWRFWSRCGASGI